MDCIRLAAAMTLAAAAPGLTGTAGMAPDRNVGVLYSAKQETLNRVHAAQPHYSPYAGRNFPNRPLFGDTHLHSSFSIDAGAFGCRLGPEEAYRFARGEELTASGGQLVKLSRPLDFLVVADQSDNMGFFSDLFAGKPNLLADPTGRKWYDMIQSGTGDRRRRPLSETGRQHGRPEDRHLE